MSNSFTFDDTHWPLLIIRFAGTPTDAELEAYLARRLTYLQRGERHVVVYDTRQARLFPSEQRQRHVEWLREHAALRDTLQLGNGLIITSPFFRLLVNLVIHVVPSNTPLFVAGTEVEMAQWAARRLEEAGYTEAAERVRAYFGPPAQRSHG